MNPPSSGGIRAPSVRSRSTFSCGACGKTYGEAAWARLAVLERIEAPAVRELLSHWPDGLCVEVRGCDGCGRSIAAKRKRE